MSALATILRRDRVIIGVGLGVVSALAWWYTLQQSRQMNVSGAWECLTMKMGGPEVTAWSISSFLPLFVMWAVMMVAMMLPSAAPMLLTFAAVARNRRQRQRPYVPVSIFAFGYLAIWCGFSAIAAFSQWLLHRETLVSSAMASTSALFGGFVLLAAGAFQFTPLKQRCLTYCRSPLEFMMTRWRDGRHGAFAMGLAHGAFCTGCCWSLMALLFVVGVMNMVWVAALTLLVTLEKLLPRGKQVSMASGLILLAWGAWVLTRAVIA